MPSEKRAAYNKEYASRPDVKERRYQSTQRYQAFKRNLLAPFTCIACDNIDPTVVQWHHLIPEEKEFEIMSNLNMSNERWWAELLKCVPLCANCHMKLHKNQLCLLKPMR